MTETEETGWDRFKKRWSEKNLAELETVTSPRNVQMLRDYLRGDTTYKELGAKYGLSGGRVGAIIRRHDKRRMLTEARLCRLEEGRKKFPIANAARLARNRNPHDTHS